MVLIFAIILDLLIIILYRDPTQDGGVNNRRNNERGQEDVATNQCFLKRMLNGLIETGWKILEGVVITAPVYLVVILYKFIVK